MCAAEMPFVSAATSSPALYMQVSIRMHEAAHLHRRLCTVGTRDLKRCASLSDTYRQRDKSSETVEQALDRDSEIVWCPEAWN